MKQQITKEQWDELSAKEQKTFFINHSEVFDFPNVELPTIGQLIEYLGNDLADMYNKFSMKGWDVKVRNMGEIKTDELINALWEATVHKLRNK